MKQNNTNQKIIIIMVVALFLILTPLSFFLFEAAPAETNPTQPVLGSSTQPTTKPTTKPTTAPTTRPTEGEDPCKLGNHTYENGFCAYCAAKDPNYNPCAKGHTYENGFCVYCLKQDPKTTTKPTTKPSTQTTKPTTQPTTQTTTQTTKPTTQPTQPTVPSFDVNGTFKIAENGKKMAAVVVDYNCSDKEWAAAGDLLAHLSKITGLTFNESDIVYDDQNLPNDKFYICVGDTTYGRAKGVSQPKGYPNNERIIVRRVENFLVIVGNDDGAFTGTEFAVTRFLEELGCGWFGITDLWKVIPNNPNLSFNSMNIEETPKFISRQSRLQNGSTYELSKRWYMGGVETHVGQHFLMAEVGNGHQSAHPDWYARKSNGSQLYPVGNQGAWPDAYWQFCYSNAGLQQYVAQVVTKYFDNNPNCYVYSITPNDGWHFKTCECSGCRAFGTETEYILNFANQVAKLTKAKYPDRRVSVLTYHPTMPAPGRSYAVESNVEIMFCMENHMMKRANASNNPYYVSGSSQGTSWASNFETYSSRTGVKHKAIWKWLCIAANDGDRANWQYIPWVQGNVATDDHTYWKQNGVEYIFYDQGPLNGYKEYASSTPLRWPLWYVAQRGSWTQNKTGEQLLLEACQKLYGNGANAMFAYYKALADASAAAGGTSYAWYPPKASEVYTSAQRTNIDAKANAARALLGSVTSEQRERMQNQLDLWNTAKTKI